LPRSGYIGVEQEIRGTIYADHRDMCRFKDARDPGFTRIANVIIEFVVTESVGQQHPAQISLVTLPSENGIPEDYTESNQQIAELECGSDGVAMRTSSSRQEAAVIET
jgi:hypothetical protein